MEMDLKEDAHRAPIALPRHEAHGTERTRASNELRKICRARVRSSDVVITSLPGHIGQGTLSSDQVSPTQPTKGHVTLAIAAESVEARPRSWSG
jgi:hypothetical protein